MLHVQFVFLLIRSISLEAIFIVVPRLALHDLMMWFVHGTAAVTELWRLDLFSCNFFLVPLCWYAVSERQMLLFFAGGLIGVDKHLFQRVSRITSMTLPLNYIFVLLLANVDVIPKQKQLSTV